jgi:DNA-binding GntR family transcriptional regulator
MVMLMAPPRRTVDPDDRENLYDQLASILRDMIMSGELAGGRPIPSKRDLIAEYGISTRTVDSATDILKREGLIEFRTGKGLYVIPENERRGSSKP